MKRIIAVVLTISLLLCMSFYVYADQRESDVEIASEYVYEGMFENFEDVSATSQAVALTSGEINISASSAILIEASTGTVLYEKNSDEKRPPASITKIMTLLLAMEAIEAGKIKLTDTVTASPHAVSMGGSQIWLKEGETMSVNDLVKAIAVASANDASVALGEHLAGSEEAFVKQMNEKAKLLGMENTNFVNCCGLDADGHVSTAKDVAIMSGELLKHPLVREYSGIWMDYLRDGKTQLVNTNKLVKFYNGATGLKTGTTSKAGYCVSASAKQGDTELVAVILNGTTSNQRFSDAKALLNYGFANWTITTPDLSKTEFKPITVVNGVEKTVNIVYEKAKPVLIEKGKEESIEIKISLPNQIEAPIAAGDLIGKVTFLSDNKTVGECRLYTEKSVEKITFMKQFFKLIKIMTEL